MIIKEMSARWPGVACDLKRSRDPADDQKLLGSKPAELEYPVSKRLRRQVLPSNTPVAPQAQANHLVSIDRFNQADFGHHMGCCFSASMEWIGRILASKGATPADMLSVATKSVVINQQESYAAQSEVSTAEGRTLPELQAELAEIWLHQAGVRLGVDHAHLIAVPHDIDECASEDEETDNSGLGAFKTENGAADLKEWAASAMTDELKDWKALAISSDTHTVAVARAQAILPAEAYAFDPNFGMWRTEAPLPDLLAQLVDVVKEDGRPFLPSMVVVIK